MLYCAVTLKGPSLSNKSWPTAAEIAAAGAEIAWDTPSQQTGLIAQPFRDQLMAVRKAIGPRATYERS
ncbi:MAG TPA: hypothetical protein VG056_00240 [Pirellulales bacterium]|nr:hypothetical protein [Pirellulales bacterium]